MRSRNPDTRPGRRSSSALPGGRILVASYYFPPDAAVGGLRVAKFVRSLPEFGWEPYVLTVKDHYRDQGLDHERLKGLEGIPIIRTRELPSLRGLYIGIKSQMKRFRRGKGVVDAPPGMSQPPVYNRRETLVERAKRYVASLVVLLPDEKKNWAFYAAFTAVRLIKKHKIDYLLTSSPPASLHLIGLVAKAFTNVRWIADFRDPWIEMVYERSPLHRSRASDAIERQMERMVMRHADKVVTTTDRLKEALTTRYRVFSPDRFVCVPNSIDFEKSSLVDDVPKYDPLTITYAGTLYFDRTPESLFQAVRELIEEGKIREADIRIKLLGNCQYIEGVETRIVAKNYGVESVVEVLDPVPYLEALRIMHRSHLLLVIAPRRHELMVGAKVFDYLGSGSTILALAEEGATSDLIRETNSGRCFSHSDVLGLRDYLYDLIKDRSFTTLRNDPQSFIRYDVRHLTRRLASEMSTL